jgi:hypothetical protein
MELRLDRRYKGTEYTIGSLYVDGVYECDTLEDTDRGLDNNMPLSVIQTKKVYGHTAIPTGTYEIDMNIVSPKFKDRSWAKFCNGKLPRLRDVRGFEGVLIHVGNKKEDTLGCLLVGQNKIKGQVINSTETFSKLYKKMEGAHKRGETIKITIK